MTDPHLDALAHLLVDYSVGVRSGELVCLIGPRWADPLLWLLRQHVHARGGRSITTRRPGRCAALADADAWIFVEAGLKAPASSMVDGEALASEFLERAAEEALRWTVAPFPCAADGKRAGLAIKEWQDLVFAACLLDAPDPVAAWRSLSEQQQRLGDFLQRAEQVHITTPAGTDLTVGVAGRTWINSDGHMNVPDGELFTGPLEDATEGVVVISFPTYYGRERMDGLRLRFHAGQVVEATATQGESFLQRLLDTEPAARILGEIAFGCNYAVTRSTRLALLDEKIGGTFHLALGAAYPATGGRNKSALHWDLVGDLRQGGRVEVDGQVISENGRFAQPDWPQPR